MNKQFGLLLLLLMLSPISHATRYQFYQGGFDEGAYISGSFELNDLNSDGYILGGSADLGLTLTEVSDFHLSFSGNSLVAAFTHHLADLSVLSYQLSNSILGDDSGLYDEALGTNWFGSTGFAYTGGIGSGQGWATVESLALGLKSDSYQAMSVTAVPLPASLYLFATGLLALMRKKLA